MEILQTDWISKWAQYSPERIALKDYESQQCLTYAQLNHKAERLAVYLQNDLAIKKGDRIAVLAEHSIDYITLFVAAQKTGIILLPLNYRLTSSELDYMLQDGAPALLCFDQKFEALVNACTEIKGLSNIWRLNELVEAKSAAGNNLKPISIQEKDPIFILYTSGTTGNPKGAIYTHGMLFWNSINTSMSLLINSESRTINVMPPFHTGGWNVLITPLLHHGGFICLLKKFEAKTVLDLLESEKPTLFMAVPTMLAMLREETTFAKADLSSLFYFIVGGESMPIALIEAWHQKGIAIRQGYGMTEVGPNLTSLHQKDAIRKKGSIGFPNFYLETSIQDKEGQEVANGAAGELCLRGAVVSPGYWNRPEATAKSWRNGWFRTGDRVRKDEEGYLYVVDRIKNMYISGGENVYPAEVEKVLCSHPSVAEAIVVGIPHPKWGETGKAFIVSTDQTTDQDKLICYCKKYLAKFKIPTQFQFLSKLPKNDTGKIDRKKLKSSY